MRTFDLSPDFIELAPLAFKQAGLAIDPDSLGLVEGSNPLAVAASACGLLDVRAQVGNDGHLPLDTTFTRNRGAGCYYWGGLVRDDRGAFNVEFTPWPNAHPQQHVVTAKVMTSPQGYNAVQRQLGRQPGVDAFELARIRGIGDFPCGQYVGMFANMQAPCADLTVRTEYIAEHDVRPTIHAPSWICSPPVLCKDAASRACDLANKYGDRLHDEGDPPTEVVRYAEGMDDLFRATNSVLELIYSASGDKEGGAAPPLVRLHRAVESELAGQDITTINVLRLTGLVTPDMTLAEGRNKSAATVARMIGHISGLLLALEEVAPPENDSRAERDRRISFLRAAKTMMDSKAKELAAA